MNFKRQKQILIISTFVTLVITSSVFTTFIHNTNEKAKADVIVSKLKGDAKSILPHLYLSGNAAWFKDNLEQYKQLGLPCLSVSNHSEGIIWGDQKTCNRHIEAKNYVDQKVFDINYSLPDVTLLSTFKEHGAIFGFFFLVQALFLYLAFKLLSRIHKRHSEVLVQIEHINGLNEAKEKEIIFNKTMYHNLRSPLVALNTLHELVAPKLSDGEQELLKSIRTNIDGIVEGLGQEKNDHFNVAPTDISKEISAIIAMKELEFNGISGVEIKVDVENGLWTMVSLTAFSSILSNLINNSLEAKKGDSISIIISAKKEQDQVNIVIRDNGHGIPAERLKKLFNFGFTSKETGKGCGLFHAKKALTFWGGDISLVSEEGIFTEVNIGLPFYSLSAQREIVLIDNERMNLLAWKGLAQKHNIIFRGHNNSKDFFDNPPANKSDVEIFVDYELDDENGLEVIQRLKGEGYLNVTLATGEIRPLMAGIRQVGKEFPVTVGLGIT